MRAPDDSAARPCRLRIRVSASARSIDTLRFAPRRGASAPFKVTPEREVLEIWREVIPEVAFPMAVDPVASVPIRLPSTALEFEPSRTP